MEDGRRENKMEVWKTINKISHKSFQEIIDNFKKQNIQISPWINNIFKRKDFNVQKIKLPLNLYRVSLQNLGFKGPTELQQVYETARLKNFNLVDPILALVCRELYTEQPTGEWLRFATPFDSMIDSDGVSHLPKLGKALNLYFVETYWSYPKAIFHSHNEFVFSK